MIAGGRLACDEGRNALLAAAEKYRIPTVAPSGDMIFFRTDTIYTWEI